MSAPQFHSREAMASQVLGRVYVAAKANRRVRALRGPDAMRAVIHGAYARLMNPGDLIEQLTPAKRKAMLKPVVSFGNVQLRPVDAPRWKALTKLHAMLFELSPFWNSKQQDKLIERAVDAERQAFKRSTARSSKPSAPPDGDPADLKRHTEAHQLDPDQTYTKRQKVGSKGRRQYSDHAFITGQENYKWQPSDAVYAKHKRRLKDFKDKPVSESVIRALAEKFEIALQLVIDSAAVRDSLMRAEIDNLKMALLAAPMSDENVQAFVSHAAPLCEPLGMSTDECLSAAIVEGRDRFMVEMFKLYAKPEEIDASEEGPA